MSDLGCASFQSVDAWTLEQYNKSILSHNDELQTHIKNKSPLRQH